MTYRDFDPHGAPAKENDDWQNWPPETTSTGGSRDGGHRVVGEVGRRAHCQGIPAALATGSPS